MIRPLPFVFALVAAVSGCSRATPPDKANSAGIQTATVEPDSQPAAAGATSVLRSGRPIPLPAVDRTPVSGPVSSTSLALRGEAVERAIIASMGEAAAGIDVTVEKGIVRLSGDVATESDFQRANYVARALDGVIEVDQSQMRVIR